MDRLNKKNSEYKSSETLNEEEEFNEKVIDFKYIINAIKRRKRIILFTAVTFFSLSTINIIYKKNFNPTFRGGFTLLISDPIEERSDSAISGSEAGILYSKIAKNAGKGDIPTLIEVLKSPLVLDPIAKKYNLSYMALEKRIRIQTGGTGTRNKEAKGILKISLVSENYERGNKLIKDLSESFLQTAILIKQQKLNDGLNFLERQKSVLEDEKERIEIELANFRTENNFIEPSLKGKKLQELENTIDETIFELNSKKDKLLVIKDQVKNDKLSATGFADFVNDTNTSSPSSGLTVKSSDQEYLQNLIILQEKLALASSKYKPNSSMVKSLEARIESIKPILKNKQLKTIDTSLLFLESKIESYVKQKENINKLFKDKPTLIGKYNNLISKLEIASFNLINLLNAREEFSLQIAQRSVPWRLLDEPKINPWVISPRYSRDIPVAFILAIFLGTVLGYLRDRLAYVFYDTEDLRDTLGVPILGTIPYLETFANVRGQDKSLISELEKINNENENNSYEKFFFQEQFRNLYKSFRFLSSQKDIKSIVISSTVPAEGKSIITVLYAKTLVDLGQKVLLIDADMRKPTLHDRLRINNFKGISNLLVDKNLNIKDVIYKMPKMKGLDVITAGMVPPDSVRLLSSNKLSEIQKEILDKDYYDLVIYDAPPLLGLADAELIAEITDGLILVSTIGKVKRNLLKKSVKQIRSNNTVFLGAIANSLSKKAMETSQDIYSEYSYLSEYYENNQGDKSNKEQTISENSSLKTKLLKWIEPFLNWIDN